MKRLGRNIYQDEKGMATIESLPILVIFIVILSYSLGSFGVIHTAILNSIAARTYAFETFRHRTDLGYFRDNLGDTLYVLGRIGNRVHGIGIPENMTADKTFYATERNISMGLTGPGVEGRSTDNHMNTIPQLPEGKRVSVGVNPVWIMIQYGICLNSTCTIL